MKNPHTLGRLRDLLTKAEKALPHTKNRKLPRRYYDKLAMVPGLELAYHYPGNGPAVLELIRGELNRAELAAVAEFR